MLLSPTIPGVLDYVEGCQRAGLYYSPNLDY